MTSIKLKLSSPLMTHHGQVSEIDLREPTVKSYVEHGEPFQVRIKEGTVIVDFNNKAMVGFLADMTGIDAILLSAMPARDYSLTRSEAANLILGITGGTPGNSSAA